MEVSSVGGGSGVVVSMGGGIGVLVGGGINVLVGGGINVLVGGGIGVLVGGRAVFVREGVGVMVGGRAVFVREGTGVRVADGGGRGVLVALGGRVRVDQVAMDDGETLAVVEGVKVGEKVRLKTEVTEGVKVRVAVGEFVAVVKSVANASIVSIRSALRVAVGEPPVFGMIRSGSYNVPAVAFDAISGMLNAITQAARRTINIKYSRIFNTVVPFLP